MKKYHYYVYKDGRCISDYKTRKSAEKCAREVEGELAIEELD